jgi:Tfp pilus assembly protein PilF
MSGKLSRKERARLQSEQHKATASTAPAPPKKKPTPVSSSTKKNGLIWKLNLVLIVLAAGVYLNTLGHEYALDDYGLIPENTQTTRGTEAIGDILTSSYRSGTTGGDNMLYRPLSKVMFAIEWSMSDGKPGLGHFMNVSLFTLSVVLLFRMLRRYMTGNVIVPFIAAAIFAVHPLHTEVVANIKGRDDILCFLFFVITALWAHRYAAKQKISSLIMCGVFFLLCMLSKESGITFVAVIPLMLYFFSNASFSLENARQNKLLHVTAVLLGVALLFLGMRALVLDTSQPNSVPVVDNYIAGIDGFVAQRATAIAIAGLYLLKLFVPFGLVSDASAPQMTPYGFGDWEFLLSLAAYAALIVFAVLKFRSRHPLSFAILYFLITFSIVSNILFLLGTNYGERLLYAPSLGFCIAIAWLLSKINFSRAEEHTGEQKPAYNQLAAGPLVIAGVIALTYSAVAIGRNPVWENNDTLYGTDVLISDKSCKLHYFYGNHLTMSDSLAKIEKVDTAEWNRRVNLGIEEMRAAVALRPTYGDAVIKLGELFLLKKQNDSAEYYYRKAIWLYPKQAVFRNNFGRMLFEVGKYDEARYQFERAVAFNPLYAQAYDNLAGCIGTQGAVYVRKGMENPARRDEYFAKGRELYLESISVSMKAIAADPNYWKAYQTAGMTYNNLQDPVNSQKYLQLAEQVKKATGK